MRKLFQYLYREKYRTDDPSAVLSSPKLPSRLPKYLTEQQVTDLLNTPDVEIPLELRDKAMLELRYMPLDYVSRNWSRSPLRI